MKVSSKVDREEVCAEQAQKKEATRLNESRIEELLFLQVDRPRNVTQVKVVNLYEDRYRINVWVGLVEDGLEKKKIGASYFVHFDGNELRIKNS
jgi:hypothetical protein